MSDTHQNQMSGEASGGGTDGYGFRLDPKHQVAYSDFMKEYEDTLGRRKGRWEGIPLDGDALESSAKIKRFVRKGVPPELRPRVWMCISGAQEAMKKEPGLFRRLLDGPKDEKLVETIKLDIERTFPDNVNFVGSAEQRNELYEVLVAFGHKNPNVGYCQGLNFIAGLLLIVLKNKEEAFWLLDTVVNTILPVCVERDDGSDPDDAGTDFYSKDMTGLKIDHAVLGALTHEKFPKIHAKMSKEQITWSLVATKWFICAFVDVLPFETVLRVWDCMMLEKSKILFRVALTLAKRHEAAILSAPHFPAVIDVFKSMVNDKFALHCHDFMEAIFKLPGTLSKSRIKTLREFYATRVDQLY